MKDDQLNDFVYDTNAGDGTWIYVIDSGVAYNLHNVKLTRYGLSEAWLTSNTGGQTTGVPKGRVTG
jgi:hypothetical protein